MSQANPERAAMISLARTQHRLSWVARKWALEDEARGDLKSYRQHAAEARRLWRAARWHLEYVRNRTWH